MFQTPSTPRKETLLLDIIGALTTVFKEERST
jgi:hypothetical protein